MSFSHLMLTQPEVAGRLSREAEKGMIPQSVMILGSDYSSRMTAAVELALTFLSEEDAYQSLDVQDLVILSNRNSQLRIRALLSVFRRSRNRRSWLMLLHETRILLLSYHAALNESGDKEAFRCAGELGELIYSYRDDFSEKELDKFIQSFEKLSGNLFASMKKRSPFSIDQVRDIQAFLQLESDRGKAVILENIEDVTAGAMNSLLKILEEPPAHAVFILATTDPQKVLPTIQSRCQRYDFRRIPAEIMAAALEDIAQKDGFLLDHDAADILAAMGDGSMRDSISLLDRARGAAFHVTADVVTEALGLATEREIMAIFDAVLRCDAAGAVAAFTDCYMSGRDLITIFDDLLSLLRDIYLYKATGQTDYLLSRWRRQVPGLADRCTAARLENCIEAIHYFLGRTTRTAAKRLDGEMCLIKMSLPDWGVPQPAALPQDEPRQAAAPAQPPAAPAQTSAPPSSSAAPSAPDDDGPPPWDDVPPPDAMPAFDTPAPPAQAPAAAPNRAQYDAPAAPTAGFDTLRRALDGKVNSAIKAYLGLAQTREADGGIYIEVPEESLIFMDKPEVLALIDEAGRSAGYAFAKVGKQQPRQAEDPLEQLSSRARTLGVPVHVK